jgi:prefoldin subunit 5
MPGHLRDLNTILVPLGDDYHVEYSAKQAREVAIRRRAGM